MKSDDCVLLVILLRLFSLFAMQGTSHSTVDHLLTRPSPKNIHLDRAEIEREPIKVERRFRDPLLSFPVAFLPPKTYCFFAF